MAAAVHHSTLDLPLFVLLHAHPNLGSGCSIKALQVQLYVLLEYFNRLHINVLDSLILSNRGSTVLHTNYAY